MKVIDTRDYGQQAAFAAVYAAMIESARDAHAGTSGDALAEEIPHGRACRRCGRSLHR
jgi:hypothetical protein